MKTPLSPKNRIKEVRKKRGMLAKQLATMVGISQNGLMKIENGSRTAGSETAKKIAEALGVKLSDIFYFD